MRRLHPLVAVLTVATVALLAALIFWARTSTGAVHHLDVSVADSLNRYVARHPAEVTAWKVITNIGGPSTWRVLAGIAVVVLWLRHRRREAIVAGVTIAAAALVSGVVKTLVGRHRPIVPMPVDHVGGPSFPSGHSITSFTALGLLVVLAWPYLRRAARGAVVAVAFALAATVGFSRLILGVHYLTDVVGGWLLATLLLVGAGVAASRPPAGGS